MIDLALLHLLEPPLPPELPRTAIERLWLSSAAEHAKRVADRLLRDSEAKIGAWRQSLTTLKSSIALDASDAMLTVEERLQLDELIAAFESEAEERAIQTSRLEKRARRETRRQFEIDPSLAAVTRSFTASLVSMDRAVIDDILDYALFLRAFKSERIAEARGGTTFTDPSALARFLEAELA